MARIENTAVREFLAEFLGTLVLVIIGNGSLAQAVLSLNTKGNFFSVNFGWAIGVFLGILVSGGVSGGHLNPAITVSLAVVGKLPWRKVPHYLLAQYLGALLAGAAVFLLYWDALVWYEHQQGEFRSVPETANIFSTFPGPHLSHLGGAADQLLSTALLAISVCSARQQLEVERLPGVVGLTVLGLGVSLGFNCGYPLNPARDLAPRIVMLMAGWGPSVFSAYSHWWLVPLIACHLGACVGAGLHLLLGTLSRTFGLHWPSDSSEPASCVQSQEAPPAPSLAKPGIGSNFLNYSNLYHQNEIIANDQEKTQKKSNKTAHSPREEVKYSVVDKSKKIRNRLSDQSQVSLSVYEAPRDQEGQDEQEDQEDEISLTDLFPDPADFLPPSPTFTFPPLPPTPPDQEEPETVTESTGRTEIEVLQHRPDLSTLPKKKIKQEKVFQENTKPVIPKKEKSRGEVKKHQQIQHQLPVPTVQITQQGSSEREILDSIALTKSKLGKKEERQSRSSSRKNKRRKEKKENTKPRETVENGEKASLRVEKGGKTEKEFCEKCYEKKLRRKIEKEREREIMRAEEQQIVFDPEEPFVDRHIEEAEVLRRYIDTEKVYDDTVSIKSYCACSLHAEDLQQSPYKLSQHKMEQGRVEPLPRYSYQGTEEIMTTEKNELQG